MIFISTTLLWGQKTFESKKFGFSMQEPKDWIVTTDEELKKNLEYFDITNENLAAMMKTGKGSIMLTAYYKYEVGRKDGFIPKIQIDVLPRSTKDYQQFKTSITRSAESLKKYLEDYEFIQEPKEITISGTKSVVFIGKFTMRMQSGLEVKVRARVYAIPYRNYFFQVNFVDGQVEEDNSEFFDKLMKTIKIGN